MHIQPPSDHFSAECVTHNGKEGKSLSQVQEYNVRHREMVYAIHDHPFGEVGHQPLARPGRS
jgi:hypothetical protein